MPQYRMLALSRGRSGQDAAFNEWYDNTHIPELLQIDGMQSAQRLRVAQRMQGGDGFDYATIYEIEADNAVVAMQRIGEAAQAGRLTQSDLVDAENAVVVFLEEVGGKVTAD